MNKPTAHAEHCRSTQWPHAAKPICHQRGAASLVVVMVLFFLMALVAAYTSRNLIFEQRTSVNQYRATQAFEAAEAGLEWALAQLNGGRIDAQCLEAGAANTDTSFRQRYLNINTNPAPDPLSGMVTVPLQGSAGTPPRRAGCVWNGSGWTCSCPIDSDPALTAPVGSGVYPAFWISFSSNLVTRPGVVQIVATGCTRLDATCLASTNATANVEGRALVTAVVALKSAIATPPAAALTVLRGVAGGGPGTLTAENTNVGVGGVTIQAGGLVPDISSFTLRSIPGTPGSASVIQGDNSLSDLLAPFPADLAVAGHVPSDRVFASTFGAWPNVVKWQPAALRLNCPAGGCRQALTDAVAKNPDRIIWIDGDLTLESGGDIGSPPDPADPTVAGPTTIIATGNLIVTAGGAGSRIFGLVYARGGNWTGSGEIQGAAFTEGDLAATANQTVVYDGAVLDSLRLRAGSFVRIPGSWRDFQ